MKKILSCFIGGLVLIFAAVLMLKGAPVEASDIVEKLNDSEESCSYNLQIYDPTGTAFFKIFSERVDAQGNPLPCYLTSEDKDVWLAKKDVLKNFIVEDNVVAPADMSKYFYDMTKLESLDVDKLDVSGTTKMFLTFSGIGSYYNLIDELDLSNWNTSNVTSMEKMFLGSNIKKLKLGDNFNTSKVNGFLQMFGTTKFEELTLNFDFSSGNNLQHMFASSYYLKELDISGFDMSKIDHVGDMFAEVGTKVKEGTAIKMNKSFERSSQEEFNKYSLPNGFYAVNGGGAKATDTALNAEIGRASGKATLIPVIPLYISINGGDESNVGGDIVHRVGTQIDMGDVVAIKAGHKLVKWTDTQDGQNARIEIPAYDKSAETWADYYNSASSNPLTVRQDLYAQWEPMSATDKCEVLVLNAGDSSLLDRIEVTCGGTISEPSLIEPVGYQLDGFVDGNDDPVDFSAQIMNDTIIYAKFSEILYNTLAATDTEDTTQGAVGLDPNNITYFMLGPGNIPYGTSVTYYAKPADDYKFMRWDIKEDYYSDTVAETSTDNPVTFEIDKEIYYIAVFAPDTTPVMHQVTFELDGGTINGASTYSVDVEDGQTVTRPDDPEKTGYRFRVWRKDAALTEDFMFDSEKITGPTTIYADFVEQVNTILDANGGKTDSNWRDSGTSDKGGTLYQVADFFASHLSSFGISAPDNKEYDGIEITDASGTYTFEKGDGKSYTTNLDHKIKFLWKDTTPVQNQHTVTFVLDGGTMTGQNPVLVDDGQKVAKPTADPVKTDYRFGGWFADAGFSTSFDFDNTDITADTEIYAKFDREYNVTVNNGAAVGLTENKAIAGEIVTIGSDAPSLPGDVFDLWKVIQGSGITFADKTASTTTFVMVAGDVEISATYKIDPSLPTSYTVIEGEDQTYTIGSGTDVEIKADGEYMLFTKVTMDGVDVGGKNYNVADGSTIVTLLASYLDTLAPGTHTVAFVYRSGAMATTNLTIAANTGPVNPVNLNVPNTGVNSNGSDGVSNGAMLAGCVLAGITLSLFALPIIIKKRSK